MPDLFFVYVSLGQWERVVLTEGENRSLWENDGLENNMPASLGNVKKKMVQI